MALVSAFRALRYANAGDLSGLITPIGERHAPDSDPRPERSLHNITYLDRGVDLADAIDRLRAWRERGVVRLDERPAIYVLGQRFVGPDGLEQRRLGFYARVKLDPRPRGAILPHERTLIGSRDQRVKRLRALRLHLSPIFAAFTDPSGSVEIALKTLASGPPAATAWLSGVQHALWVESEPERLAALLDPFRDKHLYLVDGHHRYESCLRFREEERAAHPDRAELASDDALMFLASADDPALTIYPTHRVLRGPETFDERAFLNRVAPLFESRDLLVDEDPQSTLAAVQRRGHHGFLLATRERRVLLVARPEALDSPLLPENPTLRRLDVSILHALLLEYGAELPPRSEERLDYLRDFSEALAATEARGTRAVFLLNPSKMKDVIGVAEAGEVMPPKSTFFYPKPPAGLVMQLLEP